MRVRERGLSRQKVEQMIERRHSQRAINRGRAQWRVTGATDRGSGIVVIYDHPHGADGGAARIVSAWPL
jgi:hypothetical protein